MEKCNSEFKWLKNNLTIIHYSIFIDKVYSLGAYTMTSNEMQKFTRKFLTAFGIAGKDADESTIYGVFEIFTKVGVSKKANQSLMEQLTTIPSLLRLLNTISRSNEKQLK